MHTALATAVLAGLGGMIGWGSADFFAKKTIDKIGPLKSLVWGHASGSLILLTVMLLQGLTGSHITQPHGLAWLGLIGFGVLQMLIYYLLYVGFEKGQVAVLNPVFASFTGLVALVAIVGFGEPASAVTIIALVVLFTGILLINLDWKGLHSKRLNLVPGLKEVGLATLLAAAWTLGWNQFVGSHSSLSYTVWMYGAMSLAAIALATNLKSGFGGVSQDNWPFLLLIGAGEAVAYLAITWGYSTTSLTGIVALISGTFSVPTVILASLFLHERLTRLQWAGIITILIGIAGVSLG